MSIDPQHLMQNREAAAQRDLNDALAGLRDAFELPHDVIYLDGNSLGVAPKAAKNRAIDIISN